MKSRKFLIGHAPMSLPPSTSAGLRKPACTIITAYPNTSWTGRCSAFSSNIRWLPCYRYSAVSMMSFICRTAAIRRFAARTCSGTGDLRHGTCRVLPLYLGYGIPSRLGERLADRHAGELLLSQCAGGRTVGDMACPWKPVVFQLAELLRVSGNSLRY